MHWVALVIGHCDGHQAGIDFSGEHIVVPIRIRQVTCGIEADLLNGGGAGNDLCYDGLIVGPDFHWERQQFRGAIGIRQLQWDRHWDSPDVPERNFVENPILRKDGALFVFHSFQHAGPGTFVLWGHHESVSTFIEINNHWMLIDASGDIQFVIPPLGC